MKKIKIALISIGNHCTKNIIPCLNEMTNVEVVGFYTRNYETATIVSQTHGFTFYDDLEELLANSMCDFVYISSPNSTHYHFVKASLNHNKNIIVEKTAITNLVQAKELVCLANEKNLLIYEAFMFKHHDQFLRLKKIINERIYGKVKRVFANFGFPHLDSANIRYQPDLGGGALLDAGAYTIASVTNLFGTGVLETSDLEFEDYSVDINGCCSFMHEGNVRSFLNWGFGLGYLNEMQLWTDDQIIIVDRIFSKPGSYSAGIFTVKNGIRSVESTFSCNHFEAMFGYVFLLDKSEYFNVNECLISQIEMIDLIYNNYQNQV